MNYAVLSFSSLFSVINPISAAPIFVSLTAGQADAARRRAAWRACLVAALVLLGFGVAGGLIFALFGITVPAFQIAGGILFTMFAIKAVQGVAEPEGDGGADPSIVPLAVPTIAGPGAISTVMVLVGQAEGHLDRAALGAAVVGNIALTLVILLAAPSVVTRLGPSSQRIIARVMGLMTAVIGVQFIINGVRTVAIEILSAAR